VNAMAKGGGSICASPDQLYYGAGSVVTLRAAPLDGWTFLYWQGDVADTNNPVRVVMDGTKSVEAVFGTTLLTNVIGNGTIRVFPPGPAAYGSTVQLTAIPAPGNVFVVWGNGVTGRANPAN